MADLRNGVKGIHGPRDIGGREEVVRMPAHQLWKLYQHRREIHRKLRKGARWGRQHLGEALERAERRTPGRMTADIDYTLTRNPMCLGFLILLLGWGMYVS